MRGLYPDILLSPRGRVRGKRKKAVGSKVNPPLVQNKLTLAEPAGVALAAAFFVDHGSLAAFGAEVADAQQG